CVADAECGASGACDLATGMCVARVGSGAPCERDGQCRVGVCSVDGHCCASHCEQPCFSCETAGNEGRCLPAAAGTDPDDECAGDLVCARDGTCIAPRDAGAPIDAGEDSGEERDAGELDAPRGDAAVEAGPGESGASGCCTTAAGA